MNTYKSLYKAKLAQAKKINLNLGIFKNPLVDPTHSLNWQEIEGGGRSNFQDFGKNL
jgi:hypothetical protein